MNQVEGQQKNLVHAIESLPGSGPLTALDQDLLLLKATSAATLSCLGECLHLLQQSVQQVGQPSHKAGASGKTPRRAGLPMSIWGAYLCVSPPWPSSYESTISTLHLSIHLFHPFLHLSLPPPLPSLGYLFL